RYWRFPLAPENGRIPFHWQFLFLSRIAEPPGSKSPWLPATKKVRRVFLSIDSGLFPLCGGPIAHSCSQNECNTRTAIRAQLRRQTATPPFAGATAKLSASGCDIIQPKEVLRPPRSLASEGKP